MWGDTETCPYSVGESGSRTTIMTGYAVVEAAHDLKKQIAEKGLPKGSGYLTASAGPNPRMEGGKVRNTLRRAFRRGGSRHRARPRARDQVSVRA